VLRRPAAVIDLRRKAFSVSRVQISRHGSLIITNPLRIETERLILTRPSAGDLAGWAEMMADADNSRFIGGPLGARAAWASLSIMAGAWALDGFGNFSVYLKSSGEWIGRAGPWMPPGWPGQEIGWAFHRRFWGRGFAGEAARATMDWSRDALGWDHVIHIIDLQNDASIALAERLGSTFQRELPPRTLDNARPLLVYGQKF
jgi:RimJ/RimL family protein N-acetyltransferase